MGTSRSGWISLAASLATEQQVQKEVELKNGDQLKMESLLFRVNLETGTPLPGETGPTRGKLALVESGLVARWNPLLAYGHEGHVSHGADCFSNRHIFCLRVASLTIRILSFIELSVLPVFRNSDTRT
jgi:hypothetical protein